MHPILCIIIPFSAFVILRNKIDRFILVKYVYEGTQSTGHNFIFCLFIIHFTNCKKNNSK